MQLVDFFCHFDMFRDSKWYTSTNVCMIHLHYPSRSGHGVSQQPRPQRYNPLPEKELEEEEEEEEEE